jgi:hypothetical protein
MRALLTILFCFAAAAHADQLTVIFAPSTLTGNPGGMVDFSGTLTNNTAGTLFINFDSFGFAAGTLDDTPFFDNAPLSLDAGQTSPSFEFFDITLPADLAPGDYDGSFTVFGGADGNGQNPLGTGSFEVDVVNAASVPEPSSLILLGSGAAWLILRRRRA